MVRMKCPYCDGVMEEGYIQSSQELNWKEGAERRMFFPMAMFNKGSVVLSRIGLWRGSAVAAYLCRDCKKIVIDYGQPDSDFNDRD